MLKNESPITFYKILFLNCAINYKVKKFLGFLCKLFGAPRLQKILTGSKVLNAYEYRIWISKVDKLRK